MGAVFTHSEWSDYSFDWTLFYWPHFVISSSRPSHLSVVSGVSNLVEPERTLGILRKCSGSHSKMAATGRSNHSVCQWGRAITKWLPLGAESGFCFQFPKKGEGSLPTQSKGEIAKLRNIRKSMPKLKVHSCGTSA